MKRFPLIFLLCLAAAFVHFSKDTYCESKVDASPISELGSAQIDRLEEVLERLREDESVSAYRFQKDPGNPEISEIHTFLWIRDDGDRLSVGITFYKTEQSAIYLMKSAINGSNERHGGRHTHIAYDNNTEAILHDSYMMTSVEEFHFPNGRRRIASSIRLGRYHVGMSESRHYLDLENTDSSDFIRLLCGMLKEP